MITATYTGSYGHEHAVKVNGLVNRGQWFGKTWLVTVAMGFEGLCFVVEAEHEGDALDVFADSRFGHLIEPADLADDENNTFAGNDSHVVNLENVRIARCKVNYFAKRDSL